MKCAPPASAVNAAELAYIKKIVAFVCVRTLDIYLLDLGLFRADMQPANHLVNRIRTALQHQFDLAVGRVTDPTFDTV